MNYQDSRGACCTVVQMSISITIKFRYIHYIYSSSVEYFHEDDKILFSNRNLEEIGPFFCPM